MMTNDTAAQLAERLRIQWYRGDESQVIATLKNSPIKVTLLFGAKIRATAKSQAELDTISTLLDAD